MDGFSTGDIGEFDGDGYLKITDRKKNLIVTSAGKNIAPAPLENALINSLYIEQVIVIGDNRNFVSALIVPTFENVINYLESVGVSLSEPQAIVEHPEAIKLFDQEVEKAMVDFSRYERVKKYKLLTDQFTIDNNEITPTLKVIRKTILKHYSEIVDQMYEENKNEDTTDL